MPLNSSFSGALAPDKPRCHDQPSKPICIQNDAHVVAIVACMYLFFLCDCGLNENIESSICFPSLYVAGDPCPQTQFYPLHGVQPNHDEAHLYVIFMCTCAVLYPDRWRLQLLRLLRSQSAQS